MEGDPHAKGGHQDRRGGSHSQQWLLARQLKLGVLVWFVPPLTTQLKERNLPNRTRRIRRRGCDTKIPPMQLTDQRRADEARLER